MSDALPTRKKNILLFLNGACGVETQTPAPANNVDFVRILQFCLNFGNVNNAKRNFSEILEIIFFRVAVL